MTTINYLLIITAPITAIKATAANAIGIVLFDLLLFC